MKEIKLGKRVAIRFAWDFKRWMTNAAGFEFTEEGFAIGVSALCIQLSILIKKKVD